MTNSMNDPQVYIGQMTSDVRIVDANALLTPEAIAIIRQEVRRQIMAWEQERRSIDHDTMIDSRASRIG
jgi:hypothetical protein